MSCDEIMLPLGRNLCGDYDEAAETVKSYLLKKSVETAEAGVDVVIDFGQWTKKERDSIRAYFSERGIETELHYLKISDELRLRHIEKRNKAVAEGYAEAYYVDGGLLDKEQSRFQEPMENEADIIIEITE